MDPALWELLGEVDDDSPEIEAIVRLERPDAVVPGLRLVARFGSIATCRLRRDDVVDIHGHAQVLSLKAPRTVGPEYEVARRDGHHRRALRPADTDRRRPDNLGLTGAGVVVGVVDWGCDVDHDDFKHGDGSSRILGLWDQRPAPSAESPEPYGYGVVHTRTQIDEALRSPQPYAELGYHPADADRRGRGSHGTHVLDIAAGNGRAGGPVGIAPQADIVFVHLADRGTSGLATLGDSVRILEAVDFVARTADAVGCPWVVNLSVGRHGGPHDGRTLVELAFDELLQQSPGACIVQSAGNYWRKATHASGRVRASEPRTLRFTTHEHDFTPNELELWYSGTDELALQIETPAGEQTPPVRLGTRTPVVAGDRIVGRIYHRDCDPNNGDNHVDLFLDPWAPHGTWIIRLTPIRIDDGRFHAWLERDEACSPCQARFVPEDVDTATTTGTLANSHRALVTGAYNAHAAAPRIAPFSSAGPTRDGRAKPDLVAPGMQILAARSAPPGCERSAGLLTRKSGTSMAAPHVTGAIALCLEAARHAATIDDLRELVLRSTSSAMERTDPADAPRFGCGRLDVARLVSEVTTRWPRRYSEKENEMATESDFDSGLALSIGPDRLYRELTYGPGRPVARWIDTRFTTVGRPGERPVDPPRAGDILVRVALGEPGRGQLAVLDGEESSPLDWLGRLPAGQLLLRPLAALGLVTPPSVDWASVPAAQRRVRVMELLVDTYRYPVNGAAGLVGNLDAESDVLPNRIGGSRPATPMRAPNFDDVPTDFTADEVMNRDPATRQGPKLREIGLAQWTLPKRRRGLFAHQHGRRPSGAGILFDMEAQVDYLVSELRTDYRAVNAVLTDPAVSVADACDEVVYRFEIPDAILSERVKRVKRVKRPRTDPEVQAVFKRRRALARVALADYRAAHPPNGTQPRLSPAVPTEAVGLAEQATTDVGGELVRRFSTGVHVAVFDPGTRELADRAADWAVREDAVGVRGTPIAAARLALGVAMPDARGLARILTDLGTALTQATGETTGPALIRTLALFAHGWGSTLAIGHGLTAGNVGDVVARAAPVLAADVTVVLYGCSVCAEAGEGGWVATTMGGGGARSLCAMIRDALVDQGKTQATVWGHTEIGHTTRNWSLRRFRAAGSPPDGGKGSPGQAYAGEIVFGPEKPQALAQVEAAILAEGFRVVDAKRAEFRGFVLARLSREMYRGYGQANRNRTHGGANLAERAPLYPDEVAQIIRTYWRAAHWTQMAIAKFSRGLVSRLRSLGIVQAV